MNGRRRGRTLVVGAVLLGGLGAWLAARGRPSERARLDAENPEAVPEAVVAEARPSAPRAPAPLAPAPRPAERAAALSLADDGLPLMPARPGAALPDGPVHPHPITHRHERIFGENRLVGDLDGAMDVGDVPALRRLLEQYRREYPEDDNQLQAGYAVIADCLERPGEASRAAAHRWAAEHRGSTLRRFVTRHCLEPRHDE